jgi:hypothetical protein
MSFTFCDLPRRWERWLRAEFGGSPSAIAAGFGRCGAPVSRQTAHAWLQGGEPRGRHLAVALAHFPAARAAIFEDRP